jgi:hypothetical protein
MPLAASLIVAKNYEQPEYPLACERINKIWKIHTMEYHLPIKRNKVLIHATM